MEKLTQFLRENVSGSNDSNTALFHKISFEKTAEDLKSYSEKLAQVEIKTRIKNDLLNQIDYFEEEIEIRVESLKVEVDVIGGKFHKKLDKIEKRFNVARLKEMKSKSSIKIIRKLENLCKCLNTSLVTFSSSPVFQLQHIACIFIRHKPTCKDIDQAAERGNIADLEYFLCRNNENADRLGKLLLIACNYGKKDVAEILLKKKADINAVRIKVFPKNWCGNHIKGSIEICFTTAETPLIAASRNGFMDIVELLVYKNANINAKTNEGRTALIQVCSRTDDDYFSSIRSSSVENKKNKTLELVKFLIKNGADINAKDNHGITALLAACGKGCLDLVEYLVDINADVFGKTVVGGNALMLAANASVIRYLIQKNVDANIVDIYGRNALIVHSVWANNKERAILLIGPTKDINTRDNDGHTALMNACRYSYIDLVKALLDNKADVNLQDKKGQTALMFAITFDYGGNNMIRIVEALLENGACVDARDNKGKTALMMAAEFRHNRTDIIKILLAHKADINLTDTNGRTALILTAKPGLEYMHGQYYNHAKALVEHKAVLNIQDNDGCTALFHAVVNFKTDFVRLLLEHKADRNISNKEGETPLLFALKDRTKYEEIIRIFKQVK